MTNWPVERCSTSLTFRGVRIGITMKYHLMPVRVVISRRQKITSVGKDVEKLEALCSASKNVKWCTVENSGDFSKS